MKKISEIQKDKLNKSWPCRCSVNLTSFRQQINKKQKYSNQELSISTTEANFDGGKGLSYTIVKEANQMTKI